jgi:hypothetical protein
MLQTNDLLVQSRAALIGKQRTLHERRAEYRQQVADLIAELRLHYDAVEASERRNNALNTPLHCLPSLTGTLATIPSLVVAQMQWNCMADAQNGERGSLRLLQDTVNEDQRVLERQANARAERMIAISRKAD